MRINAFLLLAAMWSAASMGQQVVQRGALGAPASVFDETQQWTTPLLVASDPDVEIYIPDVSNPEWLRLNYRDFEDKKQYVLSFFTFYKTPRACKANQIAWGNGDSEHLDACYDIGYRVRQATVDAHLKTVTLIMAAMVDQAGEIVPASMEHQPISRTWHQLDANSQQALEAATTMIATQMAIYDHKMRHR
jgi:hypothetical protein